MSAQGAAQAHEFYIRRCIQLAFQSRQRGNLPFGALLVLDGQIVGEAENTIVSEGHPLGHSEMTLLKAASLRYPRADLERATLYSAVEPCVMCCGAMLHTGVRDLVFGCTEKALQRYMPPYPYIESRQVFEMLGIHVKVERRDMEEEVLEAHKGYWRK